MIHETTLEQAMAEKANARGHSSSQQAAALARDAGVGTFIATHFSSRYDLQGCQRLLAECREIFPQTLLAEDFMVYPIR
jgi:ribonuclease Z